MSWYIFPFKWRYVSKNLQVWNWLCMSFDQGAIWTAIRPPSQDAEGHPLPCDVRTNSKCSLQLTQQLSRKYPSTRSNPILSFKSAVGIVLGTGNVGTSLAQKSNVFLSADAGLSWHQVHTHKGYNVLLRICSWFCNHPVIFFRSWKALICSMLETMVASLWPSNTSKQRAVLTNSSTQPMRELAGRP